jgi:hypothetical protein
MYMRVKVPFICGCISIRCHVSWWITARFASVWFGSQLKKSSGNPGRRTVFALASHGGAKISVLVSLNTSMCHNSRLTISITPGLEVNADSDARVLC